MTLSNELILASGSEVRRRLLTEADVDFRAVSSDVDEAVIKERMSAENKTPEEIAEKLAFAKAEAVSRVHPDALIIGADQILECDDVLFDKPIDRNEAANHLRTFRGRTHRLITACCLVRDGEQVWSLVDEARLTMRDFDDAFLASYLDRAGSDLTASVGAYRLEGLGAQLFSKVEGDFFVILGLPLLPLFKALRDFGVLKG